MSDSHKSMEQTRFEERVRKAAALISRYPPSHMQVIDRIARDLFASGDPDGYSANDRLRWDDLADIPPFTRGAITYPAKLQWRMKAARVLDIFVEWTEEQAREAQAQGVN